MPTTTTHSSLHTGSFVVWADAAPAMIWMSGLDGWRTFFNTMWLQFTGRTLADQIGAGWASSLHDDDRERSVEMYADAVTARRPFEMEYRLRRWDGDFRWVLDLGAPCFDEDGRFIGHIGSAVDITDRKNTELALRASESQLRRLAFNVESARENERADVARELHDELGQMLTALKMELSRMTRLLMLREIDREVIDLVQSIIGGIDTAQETVRRLATSLRPPALDHLGLVAAIELEAAAVARRSGMRWRVVGNRRVTSLDAAQTTVVFRIVQEALNNVARHASASAVTIRIAGTSRSTSVKIYDNGVGMTHEQIADPNAIGLIGMRERAELAGATLTITSTSGKGTTVWLHATRSTAAGKPRT